jgi:hypothetical protein
MKAAIKAINEENADALTTALDSIEDVNGVSYLFLAFFFWLIRDHCSIWPQRKARFRFRQCF